MSKNYDSQCAATTKVEVTSHGKERLKRKAFKRPRKTGHRGCGHDVLRQTVPGVSGGNREGIHAVWLLCDSSNDYSDVTYAVIMCCGQTTACCFGCGFQLCSSSLIEFYVSHRCRQKRRLNCSIALKKCYHRGWLVPGSAQQMSVFFLCLRPPVGVSEPLCFWGCPSMTVCVSPHVCPGVRPVSTKSHKPVDRIVPLLFDDVVEATDEP